MPVSEFFSSSYAEAREKFLNAAADVGASPKGYHNANASGPAGEDLYTDVVRIGPDNADKILVAASGTHGVEGFCGSACQIGLLREGVYRQLPARTVLLLVHALNPYGFAHLRRVNEDNVDLNRNFVDHDAPRPLNPAYDEIHGLLVPPDWGGPGQAAADRRIGELIAERGQKAIQRALTLGQYTHPDGLFYGGREPVWSNRTWRKIIREYLPGHRRVALIDFHSGLGPYGYGEPIFRGRFAGNGYRRARDWYGDDVTSSEDGTSTSTIIMGNIAAALDQELGEAELTAITLEFGTVAGLEVVSALRADNWLHMRGEPDAPQRDSIKEKIRAAFYCDNDDWKHLIWDRAVDILGRALAGLGKDM